ncbi:MAG: hypothetical protein V4731_06430 [Pseudomonadota bacterium]
MTNPKQRATAKKAAAQTAPVGTKKSSQGRAVKELAPLTSIAKTCDVPNKTRGIQRSTSVANDAGPRRPSTKELFTAGPWELLPSVMTVDEPSHNWIRGNCVYPIPSGVHQSVNLGSDICTTSVAVPNFDGWIRLRGASCSMGKYDQVSFESEFTFGFEPEAPAANDPVARKGSDQ